MYILGEELKRFDKPRADVWKNSPRQIPADGRKHAWQGAREGSWLAYTDHIALPTLDIHPVSAEEGFVVFEGSPTRAVYNPIGSVHGGYAATLLDTVMGCAVHSGLNAGQAYTTLELKIAYHRALTDASGHFVMSAPLGRVRVFCFAPDS